MNASVRRGLLGRIAAAGLVSVTCACSGDASRAPTEASALSGASLPWNASAVKGRVVETLSGQPVAGAKLVVSVAGGTREAITTADGWWEIPQTNSGAVGALEVGAEGYITRRTYLRWNTGSNGDIAIDLIRDASPFSLAYYRELVRNQYDQPEALQPVRRWTKNPNFYIRTRNPVTGGEIPASEVDTVVSIIRAVVPQLTGGRFDAGAIEHGADERPERAGYISVTFVHEESDNFCGRSRVGADPGLITLNYGVAHCAVPCGPFPPRTMAHEVGHAMGFWHVTDGAILNTRWIGRDCGVTDYSPAERYHARIAYARQPGNLDTDRDPTPSILVQSPAGSPVVSCR